MAALSRSMHEIRCDISTDGAIALGHNSIPEINIVNTKSTTIRPSSNSKLGSEIGFEAILFKKFPFISLALSCSIPNCNLVILFM